MSRDPVARLAVGKALVPPGTRQASYCQCPAWFLETPRALCSSSRVRVRTGINTWPRRQHHQRTRHCLAYLPGILSSQLPSSTPSPHPHIISEMDAFFTIASPVPADEPVEDILVDAESTGSSGNHGSCVIA